MQASLSLGVTGAAPVSKTSVWLNAQPPFGQLVGERRYGFFLDPARRMLREMSWIVNAAGLAGSFGVRFSTSELPWIFAGRKFVVSGFVECATTRIAGTADCGWPLRSTSSRPL